MHSDSKVFFSVYSNKIIQNTEGPTIQKNKASLII
jgi:hypothetical protein